MNTLVFTPFNVGLYQSYHQSKDAVQEKITAQDFIVMANALPDKRFELVDGQIIAMANTKPRHNLIMSNIARKIGNYLEDNNYPCHCFSDIACKIDEYNCPQPDILVVCNDSIHKDLLEYPTVVGEIFSSNRENDVKKLVRYK
ncbi:MAG: Uma2 family endonuclease, partial [Moraxella sp.]|uniref:Uma2 family endonuclease n=1 Tax=Moraxella sp. TaxID=479 RepID=UPI0026DCFCA9